MKHTGNIMILLATLVTIGLFLLSKTDLSEITFSIWLSLSQLLSLVGTVWLAISFVLSSRAKFLEDWWGGLDKVIRMHHMVGGVSFLMLINHPLFLAVNVIPNYMLATKYLFLSANQVYNFGVIGLYIMILVLALTFLVKLPYDLWLKTHDLIGITLFFASLHVLFIVSDVSRYLPLRIWIMMALAVGMFAYLYKVFLYRWMGPKYRYIVDAVNIIGDITEVILKPSADKMRFSPGQFAFVNFDASDLSEAHPFSFSSPPSDDLIRFSIKAFGDYTLKIKGLKPGTMATIWGSYGRMYEKFYGDKEVVAIAGGIGTTPFLSLIGEELREPKTRRIWMFYCTKSEADADYIGELRDRAKQMSNLTVLPYFSDTQGRLKIDEVERMVGNIKEKIFYICGPKVMMMDLEKQLTEKGVKRSNIVIEDFSFKE